MGIDKATLVRICELLPEDATEIGIKGHDDSTLTFCSDLPAKCTEVGAYPTQPGSYKGPKPRWRILFAQSKQVLPTRQQGNKISIDDLPVAD